jgi:hypothetical protein
MLKEMGMNHDMRPFSLLLNDILTILGAEINDKHEIQILTEAGASASNREDAN